jgi:hypothetical protein
VDISLIAKEEPKDEDDELAAQVQAPAPINTIKIFL